MVKCNGPSMNYTFDGSQTMPQDIKDLYDIGLKVKIMSYYIEITCQCSVVLAVKKLNRQ